jgi:hypothetical protein
VSSVGLTNLSLAARGRSGELGRRGLQTLDPLQFAQTLIECSEWKLAGFPGGIKPADILKGIHLSMAGRYVKLLRAMGVTDHVALTGGLAADVGLAAAMREKAREDGLEMEILTHPNSDQAGAIGAALWAAYRQRILERRATKIA